MAIIANHLGGQDLGTGSSLTTASISPTANRLVVLTVGSGAGGGSNIPTVTGAGMTWTQIATAENSNLGSRITMFRAMSATPGTGVLTIDFASQSQIDSWYSITEFGNVKTTGTNGADAVVQSASTIDSSTSTGITVTLGAFGSVNNATHGVVWVPSGGQAIVKGASFTELLNGTNLMESQWANTNQTSVPWTWASQGVDSNALAIEIAFSSGGGDFLYNIL